MNNMLGCLILGLGFLVVIVTGTEECYSDPGRNESKNCNSTAIHDSVSNCECQGDVGVVHSYDLRCERLNVSKSFYHSDCAENCSPNADCQHVKTCTCKIGYTVMSRSCGLYCGSLSNEGSGGSGINKPHKACTQVYYGTYLCTCHEGYRVTIQPDGHHCEKIPQRCQETECLNATKSLQTVTVSFENHLVNNSLQNITVNVNRVSSVNVILQKLGSTAVNLALESPERQPETVVNNLLAIQTNIINETFISKNETFRLEVQEDQMAIDTRAIFDGTSKGPLAVAFISYNGLESLLSFQKNATLLGNETLKGGRVNSRVVSTATSSSRKNISSPVNLTLRHTENHIAQEKMICVHWNSAGGGGAWSQEGCQCLHSNGTHSTCSCQFLPSFAMLMAVTPVKGDLILIILGYIGLSISLFCLFLTIVTFLLCPSSQNKSTFIHLQLSLCLFFADLFFIVGSDKTHNKVLCSVIAGALHYLFLACFVWMFLEGVNLYLIIRNLKVANYSGTSKSIKISMYVFGYGIPAMIVAISAAINPSAYGTSFHCWLSPEKGFNWSFLGPVCAIIVINLVLYTLILKNLHKKIASLNSDVTAIKNTRLLTFKAIAHVFILGMTWFLGLFQFGTAAVVMAYLFTIFNSVQGFFIFLVHCLLNKKVRETYWHWISCSKDKETPVSEVTMTTTSISNPVKNEQAPGLMTQGTVTWREESTSGLPPD
ncbi:adhesion G protein-coupled receptor E3 isoform X2 [Varanus komodoensis]|uniref:adhesion G protein-coupled receptor E3 isoform X2 n=1 Tax=Varanus komodoensis TaxID=61221 RepID=UPI001CF7CF91|nr:adhesion G protein-coupled receptor E3 isoform X2 [Varanus komodoensis]